MPSRKGLDDIIIARKLIHSMDKKNGRIGFMVVKVDLAKAYTALSGVLSTRF